MSACRRLGHWPHSCRALIDNERGDSDWGWGVCDVSSTWRTRFARAAAAGELATGAACFVMASLPAPIGYQDFAAFIARQPAIGEHLRRHLIASPFGTIHAATFSLPQPVGTGVPDGGAVRLVNFDPNADITGSISPRGASQSADGEARGQVRLAYPGVNRSLEGRPPVAGRTRCAVAQVVPRPGSVPPVAAHDSAGRAAQIARSQHVSDPDEDSRYARCRGERAAGAGGGAPRPARLGPANRSRRTRASRHRCRRRRSVREPRRPACARSARPFAPPASISAQIRWAARSPPSSPGVRTRSPCSSRRRPDRRRARPDGAERDHRPQGRGQRRRPCAGEPRRAARSQRRRRRARRSTRNASPTRSISRPAANRCAARSPSPR